MKEFNMKQWLTESKSGMYSKTILTENQLMDSETLGKEIAKAHPELIRYRHDGETKKYQDAIFTYAGQMLQGAGVSLSTVRGLAMDQDWAMELVSTVGSELEQGEGGLEEANGRFYLPNYLATKLGSEEIADKIIGDFQEDNESEEDPEGDNARDYLLSIGTAEEAEEILADYISNYLNEVDPTALGAPQAAADAKMQQQDDVSEDMTGFVNKVTPAETGINKYLDLIHNHDWFHHFSDDPRAWRQGQAEKADLKHIYSTLTPDEKQKAMDAFTDKYLEIHDPKQFPNAANNVKYLTTDTFKGSI
jgi:hypothetical protein